MIKKKLVMPKLVKIVSQFHKSSVLKLWKWALVNVFIYSFNVASLFFPFRTVDSTLLISFTAAQTKQEVL